MLIGACDFSMSEKWQKWQIARERFAKILMSYIYTNDHQLSRLQHPDHPLITRLTKGEVRHNEYTEQINRIHSWEGTSGGELKIPRRWF